MTSCTWPVNGDRTNGVVWLWEWRLCGRSLRRQRSFPWPTSLRLVALGGCWCRSTSGSTSAERPDQVRHRRPWVERQGEDLPFDDEGERTPLSNHPPLSPADPQRRSAGHCGPDFPLSPVRRFRFIQAGVRPLSKLRKGMSIVPPRTGTPAAPKHARPRASTRVQLIPACSSQGYALRR